MNAQLGDLGDERRVQRWTEELDHYLRAGSMPNAIALLDRLADSHYASLRKTRSVASEYPSIVSSFMPKSGGTFLHNRLLLDCHYAEYDWGIAHLDAAQAFYAAPRALRNYLRGGCTSHTHFLPSPHNMAVFQQEGVRKVWVHVRHPCEVVQASYYHYAGQGQGEGEIARGRAAANVEQAARLGLDVDAADPRKLNAFFRQQLEWVVGWLHAWIRYAEANPGFVHFTSHRELADTPKLLDGVFAAFGVPMQVKEVTSQHAGDRRRTGHSSDWRDRLDADTIGEAIALIERNLAPAPWVRELCGIEG